MLFGAWLQTTVPGCALTIPSTASTASTASTTSTASTASGADWDGACSGLPQDPGINKHPVYSDEGDQIFTYNVCFDYPTE